MSRKNFIIGIDEAGRGPLAGPVAVGAVKIPVDFDRSFFAGIKDSKKLSEQMREEWFLKLTKSDIPYGVALMSASIIDRQGIQWAIRKGIQKVLKKVEADPVETLVLLDGGLTAPLEFREQQTIIKGDVSEPEISLAAIVAKVTRDRYMKRLGNKYPRYGFETHKGYGTARHRNAIALHGPSPHHRMSFIDIGN